METKPFQKQHQVCNRGTLQDAYIRMQFLINIIVWQSKRRPNNLKELN